MEIISLIIGLFIGLFVCGLFMYLFSRSRIRETELKLRGAYESEKAILSTNLENKETVLKTASSQLRDATEQSRLLQNDNTVLKSRVSTLEQKLIQFDESNITIQNKEVVIDGMNQELRQKDAKVSELKQKLDDEKGHHQENLKSYEDAKRVLSDAFEALSSKALKDNTENFLKIAQDKLQSFQKEANTDLESRQKAIDSLIMPLKESLSNYKKEVVEMEKTRISAYDVIKDQIKNLQESNQNLDRETSKLVQALRKPMVRGRWGEIQLRNVVEMAGMLEYCDFQEQHSVSGEEGLLRPDLIVKLPSDKIIVVDAKTPLVHYLESLEMPDDKLRLLQLKEHASNVKTHIIQLSQKAYWKQFEQTPEFVVLFLPGEAFFSAALQQDPTLIEFGVNNNIIIATPTTLISLLRAVAYGWKQENIEKSAKKIFNLGKELFDRIDVFTNRFSSVGKKISSTVNAYNEAVGSFEGRVLVTARKFNELGIGSSKEIENLSIVEKNVRLIQAPELEEQKLLEENDNE
ncbi:MAG: DNA recombination protein RmuC [Candidatus Hatepunaea meridiana]|nr:DNA recombination protein RmuC [Candidatus Hatepunaea meridiana]